MSQTYDEYYAEKLQDGLEFQDFVTVCLFRRGIVLNGFSSFRYQVEKGENMLGAEIKFDCRLRETGNLYIEYAEKRPTAMVYVPSGIRRADNSWLFIIGDYETIYVSRSNT